MHFVDTMHSEAYTFTYICTHSDAFDTVRILTHSYAYHSVPLLSLFCPTVRITTQSDAFVCILLMHLLDLLRGLAAGDDALVELLEKGVVVLIVILVLLTWKRPGSLAQPTVLATQLLGPAFSRLTTQSKRKGTERSPMKTWMACKWHIGATLARGHTRSQPVRSPSGPCCMLPCEFSLESARLLLCMCVWSTSPAHVYAFLRILMHLYAFVCILKPS
jgi:hypothetical protein